jgi:ADP-ribose pyrophosphatase YjhB (NUDIX family)
MGVSRATAQTRRNDRMRTEPGPAELWATGEYAPVDHPGIRVPGNMRSWSVPWHGYTPVDITPPELRPEGLAESVAAGWAEPYAGPDDVPDWPQRQAAALVSYSLDDRGWPLNPHGRTGRAGRNLGAWGENAAADPIVVAGSGTTDARVLLIRRDDCGEWAIPGGMVDPGETAPVALVRELREETGVDLTDSTPTILDRTYVEDWRTSDHAWVCSTVALYRVPELRDVSAGDDATDAAWWPFTGLDELVQAIEAAGGTLYEGHRPLLISALARMS